MANGDDREDSEHLIDHAGLDHAVSCRKLSANLVSCSPNLSSFHTIHQCLGLKIGFEQLEADLRLSGLTSFCKKPG